MVLYFLAECVCQTGEATHGQPAKEMARESAGRCWLLACADELEAHLKGVALCFISAGPEIGLEDSS